MDTVLDYTPTVEEFEVYIHLAGFSEMNITTLCEIFRNIPEDYDPKRDWCHVYFCKHNADFKGLSATQVADNCLVIGYRNQTFILVKGKVPLPFLREFDIFSDVGLNSDEFETTSIVTNYMDIILASKNNE